jgi:hypothetical protein
MQPAAAEIEREGRSDAGRPGPSAEPRPRLHYQAVEARLGELPARRDSGRATADDRHFGIAVSHMLFRDGRLQSYVDFAVGVLAVSKQPDAAQAMVKFTSSSEAAPLIRKSGMEPPPHWPPH